MSDTLARRSVAALRSRYGDATDPSPALATPPEPRAGEIILTHGQKIALLKMRRSDWSKAVLRQLVAFGQADVVSADYFGCARLGLAKRKGTYHDLTPAGRWYADRIAMDFARELGMHVITYNLDPRSRGAASAKCTCGWGAFRSRAIPSYVTMLGCDAQRHLEHEGALP